VDQARVPIDAGGAAKYHPRASEPRKTHEVNLKVVSPVVTCNEPGQHARIGGRRTWVDQRQPRPGKGLHAPAAQQQGMGMSAADQDDLVGIWKRQGLHG